MNRVVVITGGTSGIGLDLKKLFCAQGDCVITISTREQEDDMHYAIDVADEIRVKQAIDAIGEKYGKIDILINNAGFGMSGITELVGFEQIQKLTEVNYYGMLHLIRSSLKYMNKGSKIINMSSAMALFPVPFRSVYGSVKAAVLNFSFSLRMELKSLGIDVIAFCPGDVKTNFTKNRIKDFNTTDRYGNRLQSATQKSDDREDKRISCISCAKAIFKKINNKNSKPFYIIGTKYKVLYFMSRITPKSWLLAITNKLYGGK
ncbi:MAG: SDR family NAD(P)-dependent oxidoreductase [Clostridia bacterium]|nr:SDR family NAD(P)-dependent oxidoreductase [Clostridia bacterium]